MKLVKKEDECIYYDPVIDLAEFDDYIIIKGEKLKKPFVEKPVNAEDHEIAIYYSSENPSGPGYSILFRKTNDYCSQFIPMKKPRIRKEGSFIYEEFLMTDGFDIKVYVVGKDYAHAEARKCPTLDGKVHRGEDKKELRFPVGLT